MFCSHCGAEVTQDSTFCGKCGTRIQGGSPSGGSSVGGSSVGGSSSAVLAQCSAALFDRDITCSKGMSKASGVLTCYADHLEYKVNGGGGFSSAFGLVGILAGYFKAKKKNSLCIPYSDVVECRVTNYSFGVPVVVLQLTSGAAMSFVSAKHHNQKMSVCVEIIQGNIGMAQKSFAKVEESCPPVEESRPEISEPESPDPEKPIVPEVDYAFVMTVRNIFSITGQGVAANGTIEKGSVSVGDKVLIADAARNIKSTHSVSKIAAGSNILEETPTDGGIVSLLFADCTKEQLQVGDCILKEIS